MPSTAFKFKGSISLPLKCTGLHDTQDLSGSENLHGRIISYVGPKMTKLIVANFSIFLALMQVTDLNLFSPDELAVC